MRHMVYLYILAGQVGRVKTLPPFFSVSRSEIYDAKWRDGAFQYFFQTVRGVKMIL